MGTIGNAKDKIEEEVQKIQKLSHIEPEPRDPLCPEEQDLINENLALEKELEKLQNELNEKLEEED